MCKNNDKYYSENAHGRHRRMVWSEKREKSTVFAICWLLGYYVRLTGLVAVPGLRSCCRTYPFILRKLLYGIGSAYLLGFRMHVSAAPFAVYGATAMQESFFGKGFPTTNQLFPLYIAC